MRCRRRTRVRRTGGPPPPARAGGLLAVATLKHVLAYSLDYYSPDGNMSRVTDRRSTFDARVSAYDMADTYTQPFRRAIGRGGAAGVMYARNEVNGVPAVASADLAARLRAWGFDGYRTTEVVQSIDSDCSDDGEATVDEPLVDCDDSLASVNPGAEEVEGDGLDQDCDGVDGGDGVAADDTASPSGSADGDASDAPIEVTVEMDAPAAEKGGCSTAGSASGGTVGWAVALLGLAGLRRRRAA